MTGKEVGIWLDASQAIWQRFDSLDDAIRDIRREQEKHSDAHLKAAEAAAAAARSAMWKAGALLMAGTSAATAIIALVLH